MIQGALFDMDGLLLDTEALARAAFVETSDRLGLLASGLFDPDAVFLTLIGHSEPETQRKLTEALPETTDLAEFGDLWVDRMRARIADGIPVRPTVRDVLAALSARGLPMAVVTSSREAHALENLASTELLGHFTSVVGSDNVPAAKPDPAPYRIGARALGLPPGVCAAFEDSDIGTRSALAAGCRVWQVPDIRACDEPLPRLGQGVARTLAEAVADAGLVDAFG